MAVQDNLKEARRLSASSQSCITSVENQLTLMLHPVCSSEIKKGVVQELDSLTRRYCKVLGGIIMAYENVQIITSHGVLFDTNPFNHIIIQAQFYVFSPEVGSVLEGVVKKKTLNHIGCLVHGMFNVSVPKPFDTSVDDWCGAYSEEGDGVKLTITYVSMVNFLPYITAELDPECIQELVNSRTQENAIDIDTTDGTQSQNRRIVFDDDSGISISELEESLGNTEKEAKKQGSSLEHISKAHKGENTVNEEDSNKKGKDRKRKRHGECLIVSQEDMAFTENIDWNANEEFKDSSPKTTKKRKKKHCKDQSSIEDKGQKKNIEDGLQFSRDTEYHKEDEVHVPSLLGTSRDSLKKSRNKNNSRGIEENQFINDCNAEEEFKDSSPKTTKRRKKKHYMDQSINENMELEQDINGRVQDSKETEYLKENEFQVSAVSRTSEGTLKKSRNGNKKNMPEEEFKDSSPKTTKRRKKKHYMDQSSNENIELEQDINGRVQDSKETEYLKQNEFQVSVVSRTSEGTLKKSRNGNKKNMPKNNEEKESLNSLRVAEVHKSNNIQIGLPLSSKSAEVYIETPEQTTKTQSSSRKLKNMNMTSQREKKALSLPQELEMSSITTKRKTKSPSRRKSKDVTGFMDSMFDELPFPDLELDF